MEKQIVKVLNILTYKGYKAYLVGGYVRDTLLGIKSTDIDICTNALPKDMHLLFNSGESNYGSVNIKFGKYNIDITTFRRDFDYKNRKPGKVEYVDSLSEDLVRRDFTINTICMDQDGKVIDYLNGVDDLNKRIIRSVGDAYKKLEEDPLRILRAIRFATVLDFELDDVLKDAIIVNKDLVKTLSNKRIKDELDKILISKNYQKGLNLLEELLLKDAIGIDWTDVNYVDDLLGMWAQIKAPSMPFTNIEKSNIIKILEVINVGNITLEEVYKYDLYVCTIAAKILNIDFKNISKMEKELPIKSISDIDISSEEVISIVGSGKVVGDTFKILEKEILNGNLKNDLEEIKKFLNNGK